MRGVWHDHVEIFDLSGQPMDDDPLSGTPGPAPYDNLVYIVFDGINYTQSNITFRGRPYFAKTFRGKLIDGILYFNQLGPKDPGHIGVSGGPGILFFAASKYYEGTQRYSEPDCVRIIGTSERTRTTLLYRDGVAIRTLTANGVRLAPTAEKRLPWDPRGPGESVHVDHKDTVVFHKRGDEL